MKLLEQVRNMLRVKHYSYRTEQCYVAWIEQYIRFHRNAAGWQHPSALGPDDVERFLTYRAVDRRGSASTQNQALGALLFLYREVLRREVGAFDAVRARRSRYVPTVLSRAEIATLLQSLAALLRSSKSSRENPFSTAPIDALNGFFDLTHVD